MRQVGLKSIALAQVAVQRVEHAHVDLALLATSAADHMLVACLGRDVVLSDAVVKMGVANKTQVLQQLQGPVYGGDIDLGELGRHPGVDRLRRDVSSEALDCLEDHLSLWS